MNNVVPMTGGALSASLLDKLKSGIADSRANTILPGGKPILRLLKDATWVYGQRDDEVQEGSLWAVNPLSIGHGWVCWTNHEGATKNTMVGEAMAPVHEPKPARPAPVDGWPFTEQRVFELRCLNGDDTGVEVQYKVSSLGGLRAVDELLGSLQIHLNEDPSHPCPVVELLSDSYQHQKYGKVYIPIFDIADWATMDGHLAGEAAPAEKYEVQPPQPTQVQPQPQPVAQAQPEPAPRRTRTRAAAPGPAPAASGAPTPNVATAAPTPPPAPVAPEPTARRRPIRRA